MSTTFGWTLHGDGRHVSAGEVVLPSERLVWPRTIGIGVQHVVAMFGSTFIVPVITGFPPSTTLFFSGIGTIIFLLMTGNRVPSYLGSSFAFLAPIAASAGAPKGGSLDAAHIGIALGGIVFTGALLAIVGGIVQIFGAGWIQKVMPPAVTGTIVALIGLNLAPAAKNNFTAYPESALQGFITIAVIVLVTVLFKGIVGRLSILIGVLAGYVTAVFQGGPRFESGLANIEQAPWIGLPTFHSPVFEPSVLTLFLPIVLVLIAENVGHLKTVQAMTGQNIDKYTGRALAADGLSTMVAGFGGGSATTTYAENIGVMAASKVYSTAAYWVAAFAAILLGLCPKVGAAIATIPSGVLGGAGVVLYGMIGILGARIWVENRVNFASPTNLMTAAVGLVIAIADFSWNIGSFQLGGIALGAFGALIMYHVMRAIGRARGTDADVMSEAPAAPNLSAPTDNASVESSSAERVS